ncbi:exodeoxyribonuclease III [Marinicella meishanensis]|uniref:exodeoxyribonuclease III n=1 Tax=Marinicella meishanensis TaxID=2873263 RepID=UPI001CBEC24B|nr:exodeoxyribonuclease III [Marinicella sp. NBU2979]
MKIISLNANGIRAAERKGLFDWFAQQNADIMCIQETKAQLHQLPPEKFMPDGYHHFQSDACKKGYSGVSIYSKHQPVDVAYGIDWPAFDDEGRWVQIDLGHLIVASLYMPSGSSKEERQDFKYVCMERMEPVLQSLIDGDKPFIICGDWNIAHKKIDIKNWRGNQKNSGFLPEERQWMTKLFDEMGLVDAFRVVEPGEHQYTWWSNRGQAWANNTGWRIDYHITSKCLQEKIKRAEIYKDERFSDHAPLILEYDL